jgi:hypothetical protein
MATSKILNDEGLSRLSEKFYDKINGIADSKLVSISTGTPEYLLVDNTDSLNPIIKLSPTAIGKLDELLTTS